MRREDAERLLHHHYRLHTQVKSRIDNKPPKSMFVSPKSIHYKSFANRVTRPKSLENIVKPPIKRRGQEELTHFLSRHRATSAAHSLPSQNSTFNAYARKSMTNVAQSLPSTASTSAPSTRPPTSKPLFDTSRVRARILDDRNYAPPIRRSAAPSISELNQSLRGLALQNPNLSQNSVMSRGRSPSSPGKTEIVQSMIRARTASANATRRRPSENDPDRVKNAFAVTLGKEYQDFKDTVLSTIIRRGVFNDRVIKDSFYKEIERRRDLDLNQMEVIMFDTLAELDVKTVETLPAPPPSRALRPRSAKQRKVIIASSQRLIESDDGVDSELSIVNDVENEEESSSEETSRSTESKSSSQSKSSSSDSASEKSSESGDNTPRAMSPNSGSSSSSSDSDGAPKTDNSFLLRLSTSPVTNLSDSSSDLEVLAERRDWFRRPGEKFYGRELSLDRIDNPLGDQ